MHIITKAVSNVWYVGFKVLTAVTMKTIHCLLECGAVKSGRSSWMFRRNAVHPIVRIKCNPRKQEAEIAACILHTWLTLRPWGWKQYIYPKCRLVCIGLHGVTSRKVVILWGQNSLLVYVTRHGYKFMVPVHHRVWCLNVGSNSSWLQLMYEKFRAGFTVVGAPWQWEGGNPYQ
jgi:hypothetical protein